jgi:hypothetical protein
MERREAMNTHNEQTPKILVAEEIDGKKVLHNINSELDTLYVNALKRLSKKKSKEQKTEPETEFQHEVVINPEADELAMVEGEAKEWTPTEAGVIKFLWIIWGIMTFFAANGLFNIVMDDSWKIAKLHSISLITATLGDYLLIVLGAITIFSMLIWIPFTIILISLTAGWPILIFWRG